MADNGTMHPTQRESFAHTLALAAQEDWEVLTEEEKNFYRQKAETIWAKPRGKVEWTPEGPKLIWPKEEKD